MKQRITVEQLKELSREQRQKLNEWYKPQEYDLVTYSHPIVGESWQICVYPDALMGDRLPVLTVGQMIEFLTDNTQEGDEFNELADALWSEVKEVLQFIK